MSADRADASRSAAADHLDQLAEDAWDGTLAAQPVFATSIGDRRFDDRLADHRPEARAAERRRLATLLERGRAIPKADLDGDDKVTRTALLGYLEAELDLASADLERWTIDPLEGPQVGFLSLPSFQPVETPADRSRLVDRWRAMAPFIDRHVDNLLGALDDGLVAATSPIRAVIDELDGILDQPVAASPLLQPAAGDHPDWSAGERERLASELESIVTESIQPAFARYRSVLVERILPRARSNDHPGLVTVPDGEVAYRRLIRAHTSLDLSAESIHAIGLAEVERIDAELQASAGRALGTHGLAAAIDRLRTDSGLHFTSGPEVFATAQAALDRAAGAIPDWFGRLPRAACDIVEMGAHESKHSTIAYYLQPAEDGSRPGRYYLNTSSPELRPRYEAETLAFHELIPGHHLQIAIAQELDGLPAFRRHAGTTAFIEGWGLYSERLAEEMGLYSGDLDRIGIASFDGWRACRLVVDTGLHALGWSRDAAIAFMLEHTALAPDNVVNEVDRYITWPGQALAYKLGQLEIRRLRDEAQARLGAAFDVRRFHDAVLAQGALPLSTLRMVVERDLAPG